MSNMLNRYKKYIHTNWFEIMSVVVVAFSAFMRFYRYSDRWGLAFDQAHDSILAHYALQMHKFPLLGPFSSAGPFQTGGEWYWFIMLGKILLPFSIMGSWILLTILQVFFVGLVIYVGFLMGGKKMGLIAGLFAALSPAALAQSVNLTNQSLLNIAAGLLIASALLYLRSRKERYLFLLGVFTTLGASIHLQGVLLVIFSLITLLIGRVTSRKGLGLFIVGALLPIAPLIYVDYLHKWFNVKNMMQYYLHDQYKTSLDVLGRRWKTYLSFLWPTLWGNVIGGNIYIGYGFIIAGFLFLAKTIFQRSIKLYWILLLVSFFAIVFFLKTLRTPIFDSYIMFLHPFIFLISAAVVTSFFRKNLIMGFVLLTVIVGFALQKDAIDIKNATNWSSIRSVGWMKTLITKYPNKKFAIYDYKFRSTTESGPLVMYLQYAGKLDDNGYKIGLGSPGRLESIHADDYLGNEIKENKFGFILIDLSSSSSAQLARDNWGPVNPSYMYNAQEDWYK